ncbi:MAG: pentapeptide repeat-containing protein [Acidimicrobiales bacterium]|nr:pentapeptide repeat-containing protein [Acidimicrobiales bacterium]
MNPLFVLRALGALVLPAAFTIGASNRRASRSTTEPPDHEIADDAPNARRRLRRRALHAHVRAGGDLADIELRKADLSGLALHGVDLSERDLTGANLSRADLNDASIQGATLDFAHCSGAKLCGLDFTGVSLLDADLSGADLSGADLRGARQLIMANLKNAKVDRNTRWPDGRDPRPETSR